MNYPRDEWYVACIESHLGDDPQASRILDEGIVLWRSSDKIVALEDRCVHRAAALSMGRCEGAKLRCMYHGILFNEAGVVVEIPGQEAIPPIAKVRTYPVASRYGFVWVWMGDPAKADERLLPQLYEGINFEDYVPAHGVLDFDAELRLISENLLDFSHLPYVHAESFRSPPVWAQSTTKVTPLDRGVRFERWTENFDSSAQFLEGKAALKTDEWFGFDYLLPGVLVMWIGLFPLGTARASGYGQPDFSLAIEAGQQLQPVTPMTERTSRYYFMLGTHKERSSILHMTDQIVETIYKAFNEDKLIIEGQQRVIDRDPERPMMPTVHDRGISIYNRLKARRIAEENGSLAEAELA